jgi:hypothetical protein
LNTQYTFLHYKFKISFTLSPKVASSITVLCPSVVLYFLLPRKVSECSLITQVVKQAQNQVIKSNMLWTNVIKDISIGLLAVSSKDNSGIIQANWKCHNLVLLLGIYPSRLGPIQNVIGITDIGGSFGVFLVPHEHMISDPKDVSSIIIIVVTFAWNYNSCCFLLSNQSSCNVCLASECCLL